MIIQQIKNDCFKNMSNNSTSSFETVSTVSTIINGYLQPSTSNNNILKENNELNLPLSGDARRKSLQIKDWFQNLPVNDKTELFGDLLLNLKDEKALTHILQLVEDRLQDILCFEEPFAHLPRHLSLKILGYLDPRSLCNCMRVCKLWLDLCGDSRLWRALCHRPNNYRLCSPKTESEHLKANTTTDGTVMWKRAFSERYRLWRNWHAGRCVIRTFVGHNQGVSCVQFDSQRIVSGSSDSTIRIWDLKSNDFGGLGQMTLTGHSATVRCLHLNKNRLASGSHDFSIKIWNLDMNPTWSHIACRRTLLGHRNVVRCLQMSDDKVVSGSYDQMLKIWSIESGLCISTLQGSSSSVLCLQYNSGQSRIVCGLADASIRCWDERKPSQSTMTLHNAHEEAVTCLRFDNEKIVSGSIDRTIKIWDMRTGKCLQTIDWKLSEGHTGVVRSLQTDAWRIVSAADDKTIKVWKLSNGERLCTLQGHTDGVTCTQFNDNQIVSGSYDKTVKLWDFSIC